MKNLAHRTRGQILALATVLVSLVGINPAFSQQSGAVSDTRQPASRQPSSVESASSEPASSEPASTAAKQRLVFLLSTIHGQPTSEQLGDIGSSDEVAALLREIAADQHARPSMRLRAVDSLGHYQDAASVAFLERVIETPSMLEQLRHHAMLSFGRARGPKAVDRLARLADVTGEGKSASDLQLRLTAITAIGRFGGEDGRVELERLRTRVEHPVLKRALNKFVEPSSK